MINGEGWNLNQRKRISREFELYKVTDAVIYCKMECPDFLFRPAIQNKVTVNDICRHIFARVPLCVWYCSPWGIYVEWFYVTSFMLTIRSHHLANHFLSFWRTVIHKQQSGIVCVVGALKQGNPRVNNRLVCSVLVILIWTIFDFVWHFVRML